MRIILVLGAIALPLAACETFEDPGVPPSLQLQSEPVPEESILDEITPPNDLLSGGEVGRPVALPSETVGDYRFHDHRAAVATREFLNDINAAIAACDRAAYDLARDRWLNQRYERGAQETSIPGPDDGIADSAAERAQDAAELEQMYRERPRFPMPCPPQTAMADPAGETGWALVSAGWGRTELPTTGIGFQRPAGQPERFALETAEDFDTRRVGFEWSGRYVGVVLGVEYGEGDASSAGEVPAGTNIDTGVVYGALSPSGSSGINIGDRGSQNTTESEFDYWHLKAKVFLPMGRPGFRPFAYADYLRSETRHDLSYFYEGSGGGFVFLVQQDRMQTLEEQAFGAGLGVLFSQQLSDRWTWHALGSIGGLFRDTELQSWEHNQSNFGPLSDQDFVIERNRSDDGFGMTGTLAVGLEYRLTPRVSLGAGAHFTTLDEVGAIFNPSSGDQVFFDGLETGLTRGRASTWGAQAAIRIKLN